MKVIESEGKGLLKGEGIPVPDGAVVTSAEEGAEVAATLGRPVAVKVQIPMGRRMKSGGVRFASTAQETSAAVGALLDSAINGFRVEYVLVEEKLDIATELFLAATYDAVRRIPVLLVSRKGGIDVEAEAGVLQYPFSTLTPAPGPWGHQIAKDLGFDGDTLLRLGNLITRMARLFVQWDALLLELNPVVLQTDGFWTVADIHLELDDDAAFRQKALLPQLTLSTRMADRRSDFEREAARIDSVDHRGVAGRLIPFEGDLGLLIGGGGASLTTMDALFNAGLKPANYCEIGGNPSVWKVKELTKLILRQPRVKKLAVIMNVVSNTRVDLVARGVIKGVLESGREPREAITAFRIPGSWEEEGQAILHHYGVRSFGRETSIDQIVDAIQCQY
jgi:succinyl-CoA synthetase beta subunit/citryl-CoA synthetase large subunit